MFNNKAVGHGENNLKKIQNNYDRNDIQLFIFQIIFVYIPIESAAISSADNLPNQVGYFWVVLLYIFVSIMLQVERKYFLVS